MVRRFLFTCLALSCFACESTPAVTTSGALSADASGADASGADSGSAGADTQVDVPPADVPPPELPAAPVPYAGECPAFVSGNNTIESAGFKRSFKLYLPAEPTGAPVLFLWHGLGDNASHFATSSGAKGLATKYGIITIVPAACAESSATKGCDPGLFTWASDGSKDADVRFFDDVTACLDQNYATDRKRIYTAGFSAGALWSTWLLMHRADRLAAAVVFSGGVMDAIPYVQPAYKLPVLVAWGGEQDQFGGGLVKFAETSAELRAGLRKDGHYVLACDHGLGHTVPADGLKFGLTFLLAHSWKDGSSPYTTEALPAVFPKYCTPDP